jgi:hypothetical protein
MTMARTGLVSLGATALLLLAATAAHAQPAAPASRASGREGLFLGFHVGGGNMSCESVGEAEICDGVTEAWSGAFDLGTMLRPHLALSGEIWVMGHTEDYVTITNAISTVGLVLWVTPRLWLRGGLGAAIARWQYKGPLIQLDDETESVPAAMVAIGYELKASPDFAIDLQLRGGTGYYRDEQAETHNAAFAVGFTWY